MNLKSVSVKSKSGIYLLAASLILLTGISPARALSQTDELEVLNTTFSSTSTPTTAVVIWDAIGSEPIEPAVETDPFVLTTYFEVSIDNNGVASCFHEVEIIGINTIAANQTTLTSCNIEDLVLGETYEVTVTPFYAQQSEEDELIQGISETRLYTPITPPLPPTVTVVNSVATDTITVTWAPRVADENIIGWLVEPGDLMPFDGESTCYAWTPVDPEDPTAEPTDSGQGLDLERTSCTLSNELFDPEYAYQVAVTPIYSEYRMSGRAGIGWLGNYQAAGPGTFTAISVVQTGEESAKVSWVLETMVRAPKATFNVVVYRADDMNAEQTLIDSCDELASTVSNCSITNLTAGVKYSVIVTAYNDNDEVNTSEDPDGIYFHMEKPLVPDDFAVEVTPAGLNFSWTAVTAPGIQLDGFAINKLGGIEVSGICPNLIASDTSCTYSGPLPRETRQTFKLVAVNLSGYSEGLTAIATIDIAKLPLPAKSLQVHMINGLPTLTWIPGVTAGAKSTVYLNDKAYACKPGSSKFICVLGNISKTKTYKVSVSTTVAGSISPSAPLTFTVPKITYAPQVAQKFSGKSVTLTWKDAPANLSKIKIKAITILISPKVTGCTRIKVNAVSCKFPTLTKGTIYTAKIKIDYVTGADSKGRIVIVPALSGSKLV